MALRKIQRTPTVNYFSFSMPTPKVIVISALAAAAIGFLGYKIITTRRRLISKDLRLALKKLYDSQVNIISGQLDNALKLAKEASENKKMLSNNFDPHNLKFFKANLNEFKKNIEPNDIKKLKDILTYYKRVLGSDHVLIAACNYYIAHCYRYLRDHQQKNIHLTSAKKTLQNLEKIIQTEGAYRKAVKHYLDLVLEMENSVSP